MSEDTRRDLDNTGSFEERVLAELTMMRTDFNNRFDSLENRLVSLEDKVDARLRETRPIWEGVQKRLTEIESALSELNRQLKTLIMDSFKLRVRVEKLEDNQPAA
jgi:predicted nuclease with TOPRIM domain